LQVAWHSPHIDLIVVFSTPPFGASQLNFFFNDTATTEIYTLSLHDALPIFWNAFSDGLREFGYVEGKNIVLDRKSTRLNSSHITISYAVFCLKKKKATEETAWAVRGGGGCVARATGHVT